VDVWKHVEDELRHDAVSGTLSAVEPEYIASWPLVELE